MYHLGEAFSTSCAEVQDWACARALVIASTLAPGPVNDGEAAVFQDWSRRLAEVRTRARLLRGHAVVHAYDGPDCTWEISLRPVPLRPRGAALEPSAWEGPSSE